MVVVDAVVADVDVVVVVELVEPEL